MAVVRPFKAVRPTPELVSKVAALPYDVMDTEEAIEYVKDLSLIHIWHKRGRCYPGGPGGHRRRAPELYIGVYVP